MVKKKTPQTRLQLPFIAWQPREALLTCHVLCMLAEDPYLCFKMDGFLKDTCATVVSRAVCFVVFLLRAIVEMDLSKKIIHNK